MKLLNSTIGLAIVSAVMLCSSAYAAQDYNSSRSNNSSSIDDVPEETLKLVDATINDAVAVASQMVVNEKEKRYTGKYKVTVNVSISIERIPNKQDLRAR